MAQPADESSPRTTETTAASAQAAKLCAVCWNETTPDGRVNTPCHHIFCTRCFFTWMKERSNCPVCRMAFARARNLQGSPAAIARNIVDTARIRRIERQLDRLAVRNEALSRVNLSLEEQRTTLRDTLDNLRSEVRASSEELRRLTRERRLAREGLRVLADYHREWRALYEQRRQRRRLFFPT